ncbi:MAG: hypothetical protein JWM95_1330, partial [Gemmatimonadetes bacterium]|nr:hypothetical protein [Gemmatimonadota bacterium]
MIEDTLSRAQSNAFLLAMVALGGCLLSFAGETYTQRDQAAWVAHGREVSRQGRELRALVAEQHVSALQYLLASDSSALTEERALRAPVLSRAAHLDSLTTDNPDQHARARRIHAQVDEWEDRFTTFVTQRSATDTPARRVADARIGKELFAPLSVELTAFLGAEERLYMSRVDAERRTQRLIATTIPVEILLLAVL